MAYKKIDIHPLDLEKRKKAFEKKAPKEAKHVFEFLRLMSVGEINKGREIGERRLIKCLYTFSIFIPRIKKPFSQLTKEDIRTFIQKLSNDKIKRSDGKPYSDATKQDLKILLKSYTKWRLPKKYAELTDWIDTRLKKRTPECLSEAEVEKLFLNCKSTEGRFLIAVLFDAGARAEEFINIRFEDMIAPTDSFPYYRIDFKEEYSKTEGRNIGLYWKYSTDAIKDYLTEADQSNIKAQVFPKNYDAIRIFLTRLGKKILKRRVHCHLFRKSSATYYASRMNRQQLCVRYGWKFSSDMPGVYIKRAGVEEEKIKDAVRNEDLDKIRKDNEELKTKVALLLGQKAEQSNDLHKIIKKLVDEELGRKLPTIKAR